MKDIIIINAYPNNDFKISLLEQQLFNFKQLGIKIMVVSGCDVPEKLRSSIDYLVINTDNIRIDKDHTYKCMLELKMKDTAYLHTMFHNCAYGAFGSHMNVTICKNIKLSIKMSQMLGYKNAFYTEDDNIFKPGSFDLIREFFSQLDNNEYKLISVIGDLSDTKCIYTTFFATNIDFLLEKFTIPDTKEGYYDVNNIIKYRLNKPLEVSFYHILQDNIHEIRSIDVELNNLISQNYAECNKSQRNTTREWVYDSLIKILVKENGLKYIIIHNLSYCIPEELRETFHVEIYFDDVIVSKEIIPPRVAFYNSISNDVKKVRVKVLDKFERELDTDYNTIKYNGIFWSDYL
jgi:hypothetical protein